MDRITRSFINDFIKKFELNHNTKESLLFEHFSNYTVIEPKSEYKFDIEDVNIGENGTIGIDGFAILINKQLVTSNDELNELVNQYAQSTAEVIFIQSKTSASIDSKEVGNFGFAVQDFVSEKQSLKWSQIAFNKIRLFNSLLDKASELKEMPYCYLYFNTLGRNENDQNVSAKKEDIIKNIKSENVFSKVFFEINGANDIEYKYKKIGQAIEKSFSFKDKVLLPYINDVKESYLGIINAKSIIDLMTDEKGNLYPNVFYDNVRDYQGNNKVNDEISETLRSEYKDAFTVLNNGITIVADSLKPNRDIVTITNYQIINGCQTSHVLFENKQYIDETVKVPLKLIISDNDSIKSNIIRSTNRQTEIEEQDLLAFSNFQKRLEDYYKTYIGKERLFYERRSKQYSSNSFEQRRIIDKTTQIKAMASMFYNKPNLATRFFGTLFEEFGNKLFKDNHQLLPYYVSSYALYNIETLFHCKKIDKKYKKIKYLILTMFRHEIHSSKCPPFESKKANKYCEQILSVLKNEEKTLELINNIIKKIDMLDYDLDDLQISKSTEFVTKSLNQYIKIMDYRKKNQEISYIGGKVIIQETLF